MCTLIPYVFYRYILFFLFLYPSFLLSWMFEHGRLDAYCFRCLICMCFVIAQFNTIEHVSHGKML